MELFAVGRPRGFLKAKILIFEFNSAYRNFLFSFILASLQNIPFYWIQQEWECFFFEPSKKGGDMSGWGISLSSYIPTANLLGYAQIPNQQDSLVLGSLYTKYEFIKFFLETLEQIPLNSPLEQQRLYREMVIVDKNDEDYKRYIPEDERYAFDVPSFPGKMDDFTKTCKQSKELFHQLIQGQITSPLMVKLLLEDPCRDIEKFKQENQGYLSYLFQNNSPIEHVNKEVVEKKGILLKKIIELYEKACKTKIQLVESNVHCANKPDLWGDYKITIWGWFEAQAGKQDGIKLKIEIDWEGGLRGQSILKFYRNESDITIDDIKVQAPKGKKTFIEDLTYQIAVEALVNGNEAWVEAKEALVNANNPYERLIMKNSQLEILAEVVSVAQEEWFGGEQGEFHDVGSSSGSSQRWVITHEKGCKLLHRKARLLMKKTNNEAVPIMVI